MACSKLQWTIERENFLKVAYIILEILPTELRKLFIEKWNKKYPDQKWTSDVNSGSYMCNLLSKRFKNADDKKCLVAQFEKGNEEDWDMTALVQALLHSGLKLVQNCRKRSQRTHPLHISELIEDMQRIRNEFFAHKPKMSYSSEQFAETLSKIKDTAKNLFGEDIESEISIVEISPVKSLDDKIFQTFIDRLDKFLEQWSEIKDAIRKICEERKKGNVPNELKPLTAEVIQNLKAIYKHRYEKHDIHIVEGNKITLKEIPVTEFAVKLQIIPYRSPKTEYSNEMRTHLENLTRFTGGNIEISQLIDCRDRVTFVRGIAGMGKSVLAKQLTIMWANGEMDKNVKCCIMVECREINHYMKKNLKEWKQHELFEKFLKDKYQYDLGDGKGVLFIVDGMDELYDINKDDSVIGQLLNIMHSRYGMSKIIITGRPHIEKKLKKHGRNMNGLRKVEIQGLSEKQIDEYIRKFTLIQGDRSFIRKSKESSTCNLNILHVPQFLNTFCCIAILKKGEPIENEAELYPWTIYLLLRQHGTEFPSEKKFPGCFEKYSELLQFLCEICYKLLTENEIIIKGKIKELIKDKIPEIEPDKGNFIRSLFVDVSDDHMELYQFKHLSLMEFLAALHICSRGKQLLDTVKKYLEKGFIDVVAFVCRLIAGHSSEGIIREILIKVSKLQEIDKKSFLEKLLAILDKSNLDIETKFKRSVDFIAYCLNADFTCKDTILSMIAKLSYNAEFLSDTSDAILLNSIAHICKHLAEVCSCNGDEIRKAFKELLINEFDMHDLHRLEIVKYLNIEWVILRKIKSYASTVRSKLENGMLGSCKRVSFVDCRLEDIEDRAYDDGRHGHNLALKGLGITRCGLTKGSVFHIFKLGVASEKFYLRTLEIDGDWWDTLAQMLVERKDSGSLRLQNLCIELCNTMMRSELEEKIKQCGVEITMVS